MYKGQKPIREFPRDGSLLQNWPNARRVPDLLHMVARVTETLLERTSDTIFPDGTKNSKEQWIAEIMKPYFQKVKRHSTSSFTPQSNHSAYWEFMKGEPGWRSLVDIIMNTWTHWDDDLPALTRARDEPMEKMQKINTSPWNAFIEIWGLYYDILEMVKLPERGDLNELRANIQNLKTYMNFLNWTLIFFYIFYNNVEWILLGCMSCWNIWWTSSPETHGRSCLLAMLMRLIIR